MANRVSRKEIQALLAQGITQGDAATRLGCSRATVSRYATSHRPPDESLHEIMHKALKAAMLSWDMVLDGIDKGKVNNHLAIQAGIATDKAINAKKSLDLASLPDDLPEDDAAARRLIKKAWWIQATKGGSATAMKALAKAYGIKHAANQPVEIKYETGKDLDPPSTSGSPEGGTSE